MCQTRLHHIAERGVFSVSNFSLCTSGINNVDISSIFIINNNFMIKIVWSFIIDFPLFSTYTRNTRSTWDTRNTGNTWNTWNTWSTRYCGFTCRLSISECYVCTCLPRLAVLVSISVIRDKYCYHCYVNGCTQSGRNVVCVCCSASDDLSCPCRNSNL